MTVLLLGDSNLARLYYELPDLAQVAFGTEVECQAAGGAWSGSLRNQIGDRVLSDYHAVVVSIGSSDSHPSFASSPTVFRENLTRALKAGGRWVALLPRDLLRALDPSRTDEANALIRVYGEILAELISAAEGIPLDVASITSMLGAAAYEDDGIHLTRQAYEVLAPQIADAIKAVAR